MKCLMNGFIMPSMTVGMTSIFFGTLSRKQPTHGGTWFFREPWISFAPL